MNIGICSAICGFDVGKPIESYTIVKCARKVYLIEMTKCEKVINQILVKEEVLAGLVTGCEVMKSKKDRGYILGKRGTLAYQVFKC